jgi:hypothetical protein
MRLTQKRNAAKRSGIVACQLSIEIDGNESKTMTDATELSNLLQPKKIRIKKIAII